MILNLTKKGTELLLRCISGEIKIEFKSVQFGNGSNAGIEATALSNHQKETGIGKSERNEAYLSLTVSLDNNSISSGFKLTELGVFVDVMNLKDTSVETVTELFAYGYEDTDKAVYIPAYTEYPFETVENISVWVGSAQNISAVLSDSLSTVSREEFNEHVENKGNPHNVTAEQIGLGNVENKKLEEITPAIDNEASLSEITNKDTMKTILGKIAKSISSLLGHLINYENPHQVTPEKIKAAKSTHTHGASDITSGTLSVSRGGTGVTSYSALRNKLGLGPGTGPLPVEYGGTGRTSLDGLFDTSIIAGTYVGDGKDHQTVKLGFTPSFVMIYCLDASAENYCGYAMPGQNSSTQSGYKTEISVHYTKIAVVEGGFLVSYCDKQSSHAKTNRLDYNYFYFAIKGGTVNGN